MPLEYRFICSLPNGLHARPATQLAERVQSYRVQFLRATPTSPQTQSTQQVTLTNLRTGATANAASVLDLIAAGVMHGDEVELQIAGGNEQDAYNNLQDFVEHVLPGCDVTLPELVTTKLGRFPLGVSQYFSAGATWHLGIPLSPGRRSGVIVQYAGLEEPPPPPVVAQPRTPAEEQERVDKAIARAADGLQKLAVTNGNRTAFDVLLATRTMLLDPELAASLRGSIERGQTAEEAVGSAITDFKQRLAASDSEYLRQRQADVADVGDYLLGALGHGGQPRKQTALRSNAILCAESLSPAQFMQLDTHELAGLVLADASSKSHTVILARTKGIPVLGGVAAGQSIAAGTGAIIDAARGLLLLAPDAATQRYYQREQAAEARQTQRQFASATAPGHTADGQSLEVGVNLSDLYSALPILLGRIADSVGLLRTEALYAGRAAAPTESEQLDDYQTLARYARPAIIRTYDIGGDKPLPFLPLPAEANPFLGYRGIRLYPDHGELLRTQLRAICRASFFGALKVMAPMVATADEARWFREQVNLVQAELAAENRGFTAKMPVGVMLEVPSAAFAIEELSAHCDFFSIGTNDLCQYFFAADRGNPKVAGLNRERHPAFLRLLKHIVDEARRCGKWIGLCGEMGGDLRNAPLLVGLGLDEVSLAPAGVPALKVALAQLDSGACRELLECAVQCSTVAEVEALLDGFAPVRQAQELITSHLINRQADAASKDEALRDLARLLYVNGRTADMDAVEHALDARERKDTTGLGHGFAIPHCQTNQVSANTLAVLRLKRAIRWDGLDGQPVDFIVLLAMREDNASNLHLRIFAKLARKLMDEGFRGELRQRAEAAVPDPRGADPLLEYLEQELDLNALEGST